ncbi:MAG TPA: 5-(carboxyamino)imidazole ribonucleotide synthase [Rubrobacteraceae bacterium]|nr:5-(carboxyamino)imidazole ribonucleotide synthase [Rubrobacteraceae bacterium]
MNTPILPGAVIGVLGSGQLGRMLALAARRMGYRTHVFSPDPGAPASQVADRAWTAAYDDLDAVRAFAQSVSAVTLEFENIPASTVEEIEELVPVRPGGAVLHTTQHRLREKTFLDRAGFPTVPFRAVPSRAALDVALKELRPPTVLKTAGFGYDGKGQTKISISDEIEAAWATLGGGEAVLEAWVDFACEISVVAARGMEGAFVHFGVAENTHRDHILDLTLAPAALSPETTYEAVEITQGIFEELDIVGTACVELFLSTDGKLLVNEIAPRPHNSGHWTIDGAVTSQFEQQLRAVCGVPLGDTEQLRPAAMANLLGDLWMEGEPEWTTALAFPEVKLHLYGKREARPGRKMGHLTALAGTTEAAAKLARAARATIAPVRRTGASLEL